MAREPLVCKQCDMVATMWPCRVCPNSGCHIAIGRWRLCKHRMATSWNKVKGRKGFP